MRRKMTILADMCFEIKKHCSLQDTYKNGIITKIKKR